MKVYSLFLGLLVVIFLSSCDCHKTEDCLPQSVTIIKDCTGSYFRANNKDYIICNEEVVNNYENNTNVHAIFNRQDGCGYTGDCYLYHHYEYAIKVVSITP